MMVGYGKKLITMENQVLHIQVSWTGDNFCCSWSGEELGTVLAANKSLESLKSEFAESLKWHIEGCVEDGDNVPEYLINGDYSLSFELNAAALLRNAEQYTTLTAISHASGINVKLLSHYANGLKTPRQAQRMRIVNGLHKIGEKVLAIS